MYLHNFFQTKHSAFYKVFTGAIESGRSMGGGNFGTILPTKIPKCHRGKVHVVDKIFQSCPNFSIWNPVSTLILTILLKRTTLLFKKSTITAKAVSKLKRLEQRNKLRFTLKIKDLVLHSLVRNQDSFSVAMLAIILA